MPLDRLLAISLAVLTAGLAVLPYVTTRWQVMLWAVAMGLGGGLVTVLFFAVWPRVFGRKHLGQIQGAAQAITVLASAVGPLLLAWCVQWTGSYAAMFQLLAGGIGLTAIGAVLVRLPPPFVGAPSLATAPADRYPNVTGGRRDAGMPSASAISRSSFCTTRTLSGPIRSNCFCDAVNASRRSSE